MIDRNCVAAVGQRDRQRGRRIRYRTREQMRAVFRACGQHGDIPARRRKLRAVRYQRLRLGARQETDDGGDRVVCAIGVERERRLDVGIQIVEPALARRRTEFPPPPSIRCRRTPVRDCGGRRGWLRSTSGRPLPRVFARGRQRRRRATATPTTPVPRDPTGAEAK